MAKQVKGTKEVVVKCSSYPYRGRLYQEGEVIVMDNHSVPGAINRGQVKIKPPKKAAKKPAKKEKGPGSNRATGPSENR